MKRVAILFLVYTMLFYLVACGGKPINNAANYADQAMPAQEVSSEDDQSAENEIIVTEEEPVKDGQDIENGIIFTEMVVVDNEQCTIKITSIEVDDVWGYTIKAFLENKSADKTYMFAVEDAAINGVQCDPFFATEVTAGKKSNEDIYFLVDDDFEENGITKYTDVELTFRVYDSDDWSADEVAKETIHLYPYGEEKAVKFVREAQASDNVIVDNDFVTVIVTGYEKDEIWGYMVKLFLLNKTDQNVMFSVDEASVNGYMADPFYATSVSAGKCAFSSMTWSDTTLEENGITQVETIEFEFRAYDNDDWSRDDFVNEIITLKP